MVSPIEELRKAISSESPTSVGPFPSESLIDCSKSSLSGLRVLKASDIREAILSSINSGKNETKRGLFLENCRIEGVLDLSYLEIPFHFSARSCFFDDHINFGNSSVKSVDLSGSIIPSFDGYSMRVEYKFYMGKGFVSTGSVRLINAKINGRFSLRGGKFREGNLGNFNPSANHLPPMGSIDACNIEITGSFYMDKDVDVRSDIEPYTTSLREDDFLRKLGFTKPRCVFESLGLITLRGAHIHARWYSAGSVCIAGRTTPRLDQAGLEKPCYFTDGFNDKEIFEPSSSTSVECFGSHKQYLSHVASIEAYRIRVGDSAHFSDAFESHGMLRLSGMELGGKISFRGAKILEVFKDYDTRRVIKQFSTEHSMPRGAIDAFGSRIGGSVYFGKDYIGGNLCFQSQGLISFKASSIEGRIVLRDGVFLCSRFLGNGDCEDAANAFLAELEYDDYSIDLANAKVGTNVLFRDPCYMLGTVRLTSATIRGRLRLSGVGIAGVHHTGSLDEVNRSFGYKPRFSLPQLGRLIHGSFAVGCLDNMLSESKAKTGLINKYVSSKNKALIETNVTKLQYVALDLARIKVGKDISIKGGSIVRGMLTVQYGTVGTELKLHNCLLLSALGIDWDRSKAHVRFYQWALNAENIRAEAVFLGRGLVGSSVIHEDKLDLGEDQANPIEVCYPVGKVVFHHSRVRGQFDIRGKHAGDMEPVPITTKLENEQLLDNNWKNAELHLEAASCGTLRDNRNSPQRFKVKDFTYENIHRESLEGMDPGVRLCRIDRRMRKREDNSKDALANTRFRSQPYEHLAFVLDKLGRRHEAHKVVHGKSRALFRELCRRKKFPQLFPVVILNRYFGFGHNMFRLALLGVIVTGITLPGLFWSMDRIGFIEWSIGYPKGLLISLHHLFPFADIGDLDFSEHRDNSEIIFLNTSRMITFFFATLMAWGLYSSASRRKPDI